MKQALIPALMLLAGSLALGATVFREQVAQAAQGVAATIVSPLDSNGNVAVHEQGTANVNVTNSSLSVAPAAPITAGGRFVGVGAGSTFDLDSPTTASALNITLSGDVSGFVLFYQSDAVAVFDGPADGLGHSNIDLALTRPIRFDSVRCVGTSGFCSVGSIGAEP